MLKKNRRLTAMLLTAMLILSAAVSGCGIRTIPGPELEKPVVVQELCYFGGDYFSFTYIYDYENEKEVEDVQIPALGKTLQSFNRTDMGFVDEGYEHYGVGRIEIYLEEPVKKDTVIEEVTITWDDGTETTEKIGRAVLLADLTSRDLEEEKEGYDTLINSGGSMDASDEEGETLVEWADFAAGADRRLTGLRLPSKQARKVLDVLQINGEDLTDPSLTLDSPMPVSIGDDYEVLWSFGEKAKAFGIIQIPVYIMAENGEKQTTAAVFTISKTISSQDDVISYLKEVL